MWSGARASPWAWSLLKLLERNRGVGRVVLPVLKTIDALFSHGCLDDLTRSSSSFTERCLNCLRNEASSRDVPRLFAVVDVAVALLFTVVDDVPESRRGLSFLCSMLAHRFPRVRGYTAEQLYVFLLEYDGGSRSKAINLVLDTPWSSELKSEQRQKYASQAAEELDLSLI